LLLGSETLFFGTEFAICKPAHHFYSGVEFVVCCLTSAGAETVLFRVETSVVFGGRKCAVKRNKVCYSIFISFGSRSYLEAVVLLFEALYN
jgi:hypothetical protein